MLIAVFSAMVLAGAPGGEPPRSGLVAPAALGGFDRVFFAAAASFSIALIALALMEEKPLQTDAELGSS